MAHISAIGSKGHHTFDLWVSEASYDVASNTSTIEFEFVAGASSWDFQHTSSTIDYTVTINGTSYTFSSGFYPKNQSWHVIDRYGIIVQHNSDGKKTIDISFSVVDNIGASYTTGNCSASGTMVLTDLYPEMPNVTISISDVKMNSFVLSAVSDIDVDTVQYSLDGGDWTDFNWQGVTISGLTLNTSYTVAVRMKAVESQLWGWASTTVKTVGGIVHIKVNGEWKEALPFIKVNGQWKQAIAYIKQNGGWKIGV